MSTWTKDKPTPGKWRVSIAPEKRTSDAFAYIFEGPVARCEVFSQQGKPELCVSITDNTEDYNFYSLTDPWFDGAQWMPANDPADPFAEQPRSNSRDSDLP